jgi:Sigma-70 factor, region 1.1
VKSGSQAHEARKGLFQLGLRRGHLTVSEIDEALPPGSLSPAERWLLFYSLRAAGVEIRDDRAKAAEDGSGDSVGIDPPSPS